MRMPCHDQTAKVAAGLKSSVAALKQQGADDASRAAAQVQAHRTQHTGLRKRVLKLEEACATFQTAAGATGQ